MDSLSASKLSVQYTKTGNTQPGEEGLLICHDICGETSSLLQFKLTLNFMSWKSV